MPQSTPPALPPEAAPSKPGAAALAMPLDLPPPDLDLGIVTSGLCATPEDQAEFDATEAGRPPAQG